MTTALARVNWSFSTPFSVGRSGAKLFDSRKHHWYPATFIPEIPFTLIELLSRPGETVHDPFAGIGTTLVQALSLGRVPSGVENNRVAFELAREFLTLCSPASKIPSFESEVVPLLSEFDETRDYVRAAPSGLRDRLKSLGPWFNPATLNEIAFISIELERTSSRNLKSLGTIALSASLKAVCAQDAGWGCIADNVLPSPLQLRSHRDALGRFLRNANVLARELDVLHGKLEAADIDLTPRFLRQSVKHGDSRTVGGEPEGSADLIVTSPPYLNMTDYATSQRLSFYWLGLSLDEDFSLEIGTRRRRNNKEAATFYIDDMRRVFATCSSRLRRGGYAAFVMPEFTGHSPNANLRRDATKKVMAALEEFGLRPTQELSRLLPTRRRHHNQQWTSLSRETIHVYKKA